MTRVNPESVSVALDWNDGIRPYKVAYADVQGHRTAAELDVAREAANISGLLTQVGALPGPAADRGSSESSSID